MKTIFLVLTFFISAQAFAANPLISCIKAAGLDEIQAAADLGDPSCSSQYTLPLFDALAVGIVGLSVGGSSNFQSASACSDLPYNASGKVIADLIATAVPGLSQDLKTKLEDIASGSSKALISDVLPTGVLNTFLKPWYCACRFANIKADFLATANDAKSCANTFGEAVQDVGLWVEGLGGPIYKVDGCQLCATTPVYTCKDDSPYPVSGVNCACQAPRLTDANFKCGCPGNNYFQPAGQGMEAQCLPCLSGNISDKTCSGGKEACGVSCGPGMGDPGKCSCICPEHSQLNNDAKSCGCFGGYEPNSKTHKCECNLPKVPKGLNKMFCEIPNCPGGMQHRDSNAQCVCPDGMSVTTANSYGCKCDVGTLSKDKICCQQLAADGSCATAAAGAVTNTQCPPGEYFKTNKGMLTGSCSACPPGQMPNALQTACVAATGPSLRKALDKAK